MIKRRHKNVQNNRIPQSNHIGGGDILLTDGTNGTKGITAQNAADAFADLYGAQDSLSNAARLCKNVIKFEENGYVNIGTFGRYGGGRVPNYAGSFLLYIGTYTESHWIMVVTGAGTVKFKNIFSKSSRHELKSIRYRRHTIDTTFVIDSIDVKFQATNLPVYGFTGVVMDVTSNSYPYSSYLKYKFFEENQFTEIEDTDIILFENNIIANGWFDGTDTWPLT